MTRYERITTIKHILWLINTTAFLFVGYYLYPICGHWLLTACIAAGLWSGVMAIIEFYISAAMNKRVVVFECSLWALCSPASFAVFYLFNMRLGMLPFAIFSCFASFLIMGLCVGLFSNYLSNKWR